MIALFLTSLILLMVAAFTQAIHALHNPDDEYASPYAVLALIAAGVSIAITAYQVL